MICTQCTVKLSWAQGSLNQIALVYQGLQNVFKIMFFSFLFLRKQYTQKADT